MRNNLFNKLDARHQKLYKEYLSLGYSRNAAGFRSDPFNPRKDLNVASIGCSNVMGWTLEEEYRFSNIFCQNINQRTSKSVNNWNLGLAAKSNDYIARTVMLCEKTIKPDIYLISFTGLGRREYWDILGNCIDYVPANCMDNFKHIKKHYPEELFIHEQLHTLITPLENTNNFMKNFHTISFLLKNKCWYYTMSCQSELSSNQNLENIDQTNYVGYFETIDKANDNNHPGKESNARMANLFLKSYLH